MDQLDHLGWVDHRNYRIWTDRFQIRTTSARFAEWLDYALADYGLRRTAPTRYSIVIEDDGHDGRPGHRFHPGEGPGERAPVDRRLPIDVVYTVVSEEHPAVSTASRAFTVQRLASSLINTRLMGEGTLRTLASLVESARCYQIAYGEPRLMLEA